MNCCFKMPVYLIPSQECLHMGSESGEWRCDLGAKMAIAMGTMENVIYILHYKILPKPILDKNVMMFFYQVSRLILLRINSTKDFIC